MPNPLNGERHTIVEVNFHTGSCELMAVGSRRSSPEFPPHPARLFAAIVGGYYNHKLNADEENSEDLQRLRGAVESLEGVDPPSIYYPEVNFTHPTTEYRVDAAMLYPDKSYPEDFKELVKWDKPKYRSAALTVRGYFPSSTKVYYVYTGQEAAKALREIEPLLERIYYIGRADSFAYVRVLPEAEDIDRNESRGLYRVLRPHDRGKHHIRIHYKGFMANLDASFEDSTFPRMVVCRYNIEGDAPEPVSAGWEIVDLYGITPKIPAFMALPLGYQVSKILLRMACDLNLDEDVQRIIHGHATDSGPLREKHLAVFPLTEVGHPNSSGLIAGFGIALPVDCPHVDAIRKLMSDMVPSILVGGHPVRIHHNPSQVAKVYQPHRWGAVSDQWASVLPLAIPFTGVPSTVEPKHQLPYSAAVMFKRHGLDVKSVRVQGHPFFAGTLPLENEWLAHWPDRKRPKHLWYVHVTLKDKVRGPLLDGIDMHKGLSPFLPYSLEPYECP